MLASALSGAVLPHPRLLVNHFVLRWRPHHAVVVRTNPFPRQWPWHIITCRLLRVGLSTSRSFVDIFRPHPMTVTSAILRLTAVLLTWLVICDTTRAFRGVQPLSARRYELGRFFRSITQSDSCLHDLLPQWRDSEILSRLQRHTVYPIPPRLKNIVLLFTMPWLNISNCNRICKISSALYIDVCIDCLRRAVVLIGLFAINGLFVVILYCVFCVYYSIFNIHAVHCISFSLSASF